MASLIHPISISQKSVINLTSHDRAWHIASHPRLPIIAVSSASSSVQIYSLLNFQLLSTISGGHKRSIRSSAWKPGSDAESVLATASFDFTVGIWKQWNRPKGMEAYLDPTNPVDDEDNEWSFAVLLDGHDSEVKSVSWSASGSLLATCSRDKSIWIWEDLEDEDNNFETVAVLQDHSADVKCVQWHPSEDCLASGSYDNSIRIWREDVDDWTQVACLQGHTGTVWSIDWEPDVYGTKITEKEDTIIATLWKLDGSLTTVQQQRWVNAFVACGQRIVSCSDDRTVRIWRKRPGKEITTQSDDSLSGVIYTSALDEIWVEESMLPSGHELAIYSVAWSKDNGLIASTGADGRICIYQEYLRWDEDTCFPVVYQFQGSQMSGAGVSERDTNLLQAQGLYAGKGSGKPCATSGTMQGNDTLLTATSEWRLVSTLDAAHGVYEINHLCWVAWKGESNNNNRLSDDILQKKHYDKKVGTLLSSGDDGKIHVWAIENLI
ncbi:Cytosolic iron-sulfur protein assembly protein [Myotisia sp. PD_48]|nr:Cytosolic iron-sulfur protein assembly protein [Myotisia sp. PD_48]